LVRGEAGKIGMEGVRDGWAVDPQLGPADYIFGVALDRAAAAASALVDGACQSCVGYPLSTVSSPD
jgi:hypothetical protein